MIYILEWSEGEKPCPDCSLCGGQANISMNALTLTAETRTRQQQVLAAKPLQVSDQSRLTAPVTLKVPVFL